MSRQQQIVDTLTEAFNLHQQGYLDAAEAGYRRVLALMPNQFDALHMLGVVESSRGREEAALSLLQRALRVNPQSPRVHSNLGSTLRALKRREDALRSLERALALQPDMPEALNNRGNVLREMGRLDEALACFDRLLALYPRDADGHDNRGTVLLNLGRFAEAIDSHLLAQAYAPGHVSAMWNESLLRLLNGDFARGWPKYEAGGALGLRWTERGFASPAWRGGLDLLAGKRVLLYAEQGMGDTLQFSRYAGIIKAAGAREVILEVQPALRRLLGGLAGVDRLCVRGEALPEFDLHCPLLSVPGAMGTTLDTVPAQMAYLAADTALCAKFRDALGPRRGLRVGLTWSGNRAHVNDHNRSMSLDTLRPLFDMPLEWIGVQNDVRAGDKRTLRKLPQLQVFDALPDFAETAALIAELDLVISVDTAVAHLAGALGKPTWLMLPFVPDWRWLLDRDDSPWYPTMRLFRQRERGNWAGVIDAVGAALRARVSGAN